MNQIQTASAPFRGVKSRLSRLAYRLLWRLLLLGLPRVTILAAGLAVITFALDWALHLPRPVRVVLLLVSAALLGIAVARHVLRPLFRKPSLDELALLVEAHDPGLKDQLISAIQLERDLDEGRAVESPELIRALVSDTAARLDRYSFGRAVSLRPVLRPALLGALAVAAVVSLGASFPLETGLWVQRQLLLRDVPWPRATTLVIHIPEIGRYDPVQEGDRIILHVPERTPLQVRVTAEGVLPDEVELVTAPLDDPDLEHAISMGRPRGQDAFQHIFLPLTRSMTLFARGGDDDDEIPIYEIRVARAPRVTRFWADYDYPAYTGLADRSLPDANISAPEGTLITMHFEANMPLSSFMLGFQQGGEQPLSPDAEGHFGYEFTVTGSDFYTYDLKGGNGVLSAQVPRYVITAEADQAPRVLVELPESTDLMVTPDALIPLRGAATDDYGVTAVGLRWEPREAQPTVSGGIAFEGQDLLGALGDRRVPFFHALDMQALQVSPPDGTTTRQPTEGDALGFRFLVADNRETRVEPEPHRVFGDYEYRILVLSAQDLERDLGQRQVRLKDQVRRLRDQVIARIDETHGIVDLLQGYEEGAIPPQAMTGLSLLEGGLNGVTIQLQNGSSQFNRVFEAYLWNRIDPGNLTERLMSTLVRMYRDPALEDRDRILGDALEEVRPLIEETRSMGRLAAIMDVFLRAADQHAPEARRSVERARLLTDPVEQTQQLQSALRFEELLREDLDQLVEKLEAWEDYLDLVQSLRDLLEAQQGIEQRIEKIADK